MSDRENGVASDMSPEEHAQLEAMVQQAHEQAVHGLAGVLQAFFPGIREADLLREANGALIEQKDLEERVLADAIDPAKREEAPRWGVQVKQRTNPANELGTVVPKLNTELRTPQETFQWCAVFAFATSPAARAAFRLMGYQIRFVQVRAQRIITR